MKKFIGFLLILALVMSLSVSAFAATQTVALSPADADNASITINNPAKGETYSLYKLFDATVGSGQNPAISYQGTIPDTLTDYFEYTSTGSGYVQAKPAAFNTVKYYTDAAHTTESTTATAFWTGEGMSDGLKAALEAWAKTATPVNSAESDGKEALAFTGLPYGYYVMLTSHKSDPVGNEEAKSLITVDSTYPNASIYDKNVNVPGANKTVENASYSIGDTIKYTAEFATTNYLKDSSGKYWQVIEYTVSDTLPAYLSGAIVTKVTIGGADYKVGEGESAAYPQFDADKKIVIPWATKGDDDKYTNNYTNGAVIHIEYQATLTDVVRVEEQNKNVVTIRPTVTDDNDTPPTPWEEHWDDDAVIKTYATALKKTDGTNRLAGAKFKVPGLLATKTADGVYTVDSYDPTIKANVTSYNDTDMTDANSTTLEVNANGMLYIVGLADDVSLDIWEIEAPSGYNLLTTKTVLTVQKIGEEIYKLNGYRKYDADGNIIEETVTETTGYTEVISNITELDENAVTIVNKPGQELPSTGGIGTTIFYIIGGILVVGAGVVLVTRKKTKDD